MNTPHPSGKLARWGLALQEVDLSIHYRPGKRNANADALSRSPIPPEGADHTPGSGVFGIMSALQVHQVPAKDGEADLGARQRGDPELREIMDFVQSGTLPEEEKRARELVLAKTQYVVIDDILYHLQADKSLRVIPPKGDREKLFHEAHDGAFGAHLQDKKVHSELNKHHWWSGMRADIVRWCRGCLTCLTRRAGRRVKAPLTPIPVAGPFDRVGVDVIHFPKSYNGNQYAVVFMDYLTKWPEVYPTSDQTALTIATLLVEKIISRHGVPAELLSDRGAAFLSHLLKEVCGLMGIHRLNTTSYHPQTDGLVERFNRTLTDMLAKKAEKSGQDWDTHLPYVLFAYRASRQESTGESPFFLLYGRDPRLPTELQLDAPSTRIEYDLDTYKGEVATRLQEAWKLAQDQVKKAQKRQKSAFDRQARQPVYSVGERVFVYMPAAKASKAYKFARPFYGPYRVVTVYDTGLEVRPVDRPQETPFRISFVRVRRCPEQIPDTFWPLKASSRQTSQARTTSSPNQDSAASSSPTKGPDIAKPASTGVWGGRLRSSRRSGGDTLPKDGEL